MDVYWYIICVLLIGALCAYVIRLRVSYTENDESRRRNELILSVIASGGASRRGGDGEGLI